MNVREILEEFQVPVRNDGKHTSQGWLQFDCPWCGTDTRKFHMGYNVAGHFVNCWKCGWHPLLATMREILQDRATKQQIREVVGDIANAPQGGIRKHSGRFKEPAGVGPLRAAHRKYLHKRRYDWRALSEMWRVQGIDMRGEPPWRIYIPVEQQGELVAWTSRSITNDTAKARYKSSSLEDSNTPIKNTIYGVDLCQSTAILVEGPFDVWRIGPGAVCGFGVDISPGQILLLSQFARVYIAFDKGRRAQWNANKIAEQLCGLDVVTYIVALDKQYKDPGEMTDGSVRLLRRKVLDI